MHRLISSDERLYFLIVMPAPWALVMHHYCWIRAGFPVTTVLAHARRRLCEPDCREKAPAPGTLGPLARDRVLRRCVMNWIGTWRNQYGSTLSITDDKEGAIRGVFSTALQDSAFFGHDLPVSGVWFGDCINFAFGISNDRVTVICSFTGMLRDGTLQTVWHVVTSQAPRQGSRSSESGWAHAVQTNADTFERVAG